MSGISTYNPRYNGLGCSGPVAGWTDAKEQCARAFDAGVRKIEADSLSPPPKNKKTTDRQLDFNK